MSTLPIRGSHWSIRGHVYRVNSVDKRYVYLEDVHGEGTTPRVPVEKWPSQYVSAWPPAPDSKWVYQPEEFRSTQEESFTILVKYTNAGIVTYLDPWVDKMQKVDKETFLTEFVPYYEIGSSKILVACLVGGGREKGHLSSLKELAIQIGVDIQFHIPVGTPIAPNWKVPAGVEVVIGLPRFSSGDVQSIAKRAAKEQGVPYVLLETAKHEFQSGLWEALRDHYPELYVSQFGALGIAMEYQPSTQTWIQQEEGWILEDDTTDSGQLPSGRDGASSGTSTAIATGLTVLALMAAWGSGR